MKTNLLLPAVRGPAHEIGQMNFTAPLAVKENKQPKQNESL
jgi:hypothetical protein